jgi:predicted ATP-dependent serine protease
MVCKTCEVDVNRFRDKKIGDCQICHTYNTKKTKDQKKVYLERKRKQYAERPNRDSKWISMPTFRNPLNFVITISRLSTNPKADASIDFEHIHHDLYEYGKKGFY